MRVITTYKIAIALSVLLVTSDADAQQLDLWEDFRPKSLLDELLEPPTETHRLYDQRTQEQVDGKPDACSRLTCDVGDSEMGNCGDFASRKRQKGGDCYCRGKEGTLVWEGICS